MIIGHDHGAVAAHGCIGVEVAEMAAADAPDHVRVEIVDSAGHFLYREQPAHVNQLIVDHLTT